VPLGIDMKWLLGVPGSSVRASIELSLNGRPMMRQQADNTGGWM